MQDLVEFPLKQMNIWGYLVPYPNKKSSIMLILCELSLAFSCIISTLNYFYSSSIDEVTDNFQSNSAYCNAFAKLTLCTYYKTEFLNLFDKRRGFWDTTTCSSTTKNDIAWIEKIVVFLQKAFVYQCVGIALVVLVPLAIVKETLIFGVFYIPADPLTFFIVWTNDALSTLVTVFVLISFDCIFMGLCYEVIAQFKILYEHLERMDVENINSEEELEDFVHKFEFYSEHHKFLLRYIQDIKDRFSTVYLIEYIVTAPTSCAYMYLALESSVLMKKFINIMICIDAICEFAIFCIPATYMTEETKKISNAIYSSNWYGKHFNKLKKATQLTIQKAQQEIRMTSLGGLVQINSQILITVVKTSFSICTVLLSLKKKTS